MRIIFKGNLLTYLQGVLFFLSTSLVFSPLQCTVEISIFEKFKNPKQQIVGLSY